MAGSTAVGHVGWAKRTITVGAQDVTIAGVGGVLVAPMARGQFYSSCGWQRITAAECWTNREGTVVDSPAGHPLFILSIHKILGAWPAGQIDLGGRPW